MKKLNFMNKLRINRFTKNIRMPSLAGVRGFGRLNIETGNNFVFYGTLLVILGTIFMPFLIVQGAEKVEQITYSEESSYSVVWNYDGIENIDWTIEETFDSGYGQIFYNAYPDYNFSHNTVNGGSVCVVPSGITVADAKAFSFITSYNIQDAVDDGIRYFILDITCFGTYAGSGYSIMKIGFISQDVSAADDERLNVEVFTDNLTANDGVNDFQGINGTKFWFSALQMLAVKNDDPNARFAFYFRNEMYNIGDILTFDIRGYGSSTTLIPVSINVYDKVTIIMFTYAIGSSIIFFYALNIFHFRDVVGKINLRRKEVKGIKERDRLRYGEPKKKGIFRRLIPWM